MVCTGMSNVKYKDGVRHIAADILSSTVPSPMPTTGENIEGLAATDVLSTGSTVYIVNTGALFMMNEEGEFKEQ